MREPPREQESFLAPKHPHVLQGEKAEKEANFMRLSTHACGDFCMLFLSKGKAT